MQKTDKKAFTLIELLVVISIIGLLSSIVLASLASARDKAKIANIQQNLANMVNTVELAYDGDYSEACTVVQPMIDAIEANGGYASCYVHNSPGNQYSYENWAVSAHLISDRMTNYSVDSDGLVVWDKTNSAGNWSTVMINCQNASKKLPSVEMFKSLDLAQYKHGSRVPADYGFSSTYYWTSTDYSATHSYSFPTSNGTPANSPQGNWGGARCVK